MEIQKENYEEIESKANDFYKMIGDVWCPKLGGFVAFNRQGFHHLIFSKNTPRPKSERKRRFALLPYAPNILNDSNAVISHDMKEIRNFKAHFWIFSKMIDNVHVSLVVRQTGNGKKHFFSIYGKTQKSTP